MKDYSNMSLEEFNPFYTNINSLKIKEENNFSHAEGSNSKVYGNISRGFERPDTIVSGGISRGFERPDTIVSGGISRGFVLYMEEGVTKAEEISNYEDRKWQDS